MALLLCTLWRKDRGEGVDFTLGDFGGGGWIFGVCNRKVGSTPAPLLCLYHESSSSVTNLLNSYLTFPRETPEVLCCPVVFTG